MTQLRRSIAAEVTDAAILSEFAKSQPDGIGCHCHLGIDCQSCTVSERQPTSGLTIEPKAAKVLVSWSESFWHPARALPFPGAMLFVFLPRR